MNNLSSRPAKGASLLVLLFLTVGVLSVSENSDAGVFKKLKKKAKKAAGSVEKISERAANRIGDQVLEKSTTIGKQISKTGNRSVHEILEGKKVVGRAVIEGGRVVATQTLEGGRVISEETEEGGRFIVRNSEIVGREVVVNGKVVGEEVIKNGKIVGHNVIAAGDYVVDAGNLVYNKLTALECQSTVKAIRSGTKVKLPAVPFVPGLPDIDTLVKEMTLVTADQMQSMNKNKTINMVAGQMEKHADNIPDIKRIVAVINKNKNSVMDLFSPKVFCSLDGPKIDSMLEKLDLLPVQKFRSLMPENMSKKQKKKERKAAEGKHFYYAYNLSMGAAAVGGAAYTLSVITDFRGHGGGYITVGPQVVTNVAFGAAMGPTYFPKVSEADLEGWGWSLAVSGGPPTKILSGSVDVGMDEDFKVFQGFGTSGSIGLGVIPGDAAAAYTYTFKATR